MTPDEHYMQKCIDLSKTAIAHGEMPFASLITRGDSIIAQSENAVGKEKDVTEHAEIVVMKMAQKLMKPEEFAECTLYTNVEPCPMCSFMIRELKFKKVVFSLHSPIMGGFSKWPILQDRELEQLTGYFGRPPEVVGGVLEEETESIWKSFPITPKGTNKQ